MDTGPWQLQLKMGIFLYNHFDDKMRMLFFIALLLDKAYNKNMKTVESLSSIPPALHRPSQGKMSNKDKRHFAELIFSILFNQYLDSY